MVERKREREREGGGGILYLHWKFGWSPSYRAGNLPNSRPRSKVSISSINAQPKLIVQQLNLHIFLSMRILQSSSLWLQYMNDYRYDSAMKVKLNIYSFQVNYFNAYLLQKYGLLTHCRAHLPSLSVGWRAWVRQPCLHPSICTRQ